MQKETHNCQNCKKSFVIEPDDFLFYKKMQVPPPTWCPECRMIRRMAWQGYRILYKRKCDFTGDMVISTHRPDSPHKIYRQDIWWSDKWDPKSYGRDYDFSRSFFEQFRDLLQDVPLPALNAEYLRMVNSEYCNASTELRNCYLTFRTTKAEDSAYLNTIVDVKNSFDLLSANYSELSYDAVEIQKCYQVFHSQDCEDSHHIWFSRDLVGCSYCIGCVNLRSKNYYIFNEPHTKEAFEEKLKGFDFGSAAFVSEFKRKVAAVAEKQPRKFMHGVKNTDVSGDYIFNSRDVLDSYMVRSAEHVRYSQFLKNGPTANCYDYSFFSDGAEWIYESCWTGLNVNNVKFCVWDYRDYNLEYSFGCMGSGNCFGCVGVRKGEYCILNKQYSKEEYVDMVSRIKRQMSDVPYVDRIGRVYRYGEFFPPEFCPWSYNNSAAYEWFPIAKEEALRQGFNWADHDAREYQDATVVVSDHIKDVADDILRGILKCETCGKNYQIIRIELEFYRRFQIPIPRQCPLCRERARFARLNPIAIFNRRCAKCNRDVKSTYAPARPEIVYCESCYNSEVA